MNIKHQSPFTGNKNTDFNKFSELDVQRGVAFDMIKKEEDGTVRRIPVHGITARDITTVRKDVEAAYNDSGVTFSFFCSQNGLSLYEREAKCMANSTFLAAVQKYIFASKNPQPKLDLSAYDQAISSFASVCNKLQEKRANQITLSEIHGYLKILGILSVLTEKPENLKASLNENSDLNSLLKTDNSFIKQTIQYFLNDPLKGTHELNKLIAN